MRLYSYDMTETDGLSVGSNYTHYINVLPKGDKHFFSKEYNVTAAPVGAYGKTTSTNFHKILGSRILSQVFIREILVVITNWALVTTSQY